MIVVRVSNCRVAKNIIPKVPELFAFGAVLVDVVNEGKQNDINLKVEISGAVNRQVKGGKQNDIIQKFKNQLLSIEECMEESKRKELSSLKSKML